MNEDLVISPIAMNQHHRVIGFKPSQLQHQRQLPVGAKVLLRVPPGTVLVRAIKVMAISSQFRHTLHHHCATHADEDG